MPKIVGYVGEVPPAGAQPSPWLPTAAVFAGAYGMLWLASRWNNRLVANPKSNPIPEFRQPILDKIQTRTKESRARGKYKEVLTPEAVEQLMKLPPGVYTYDLDPQFAERQYWDDRLTPAQYRPKKFNRERWRRYKSSTTLRGAFYSASRAAEGSDSRHVLVDTRGEPLSTVEGGYAPADPAVLGVYREDGVPLFLIYSDDLAKYQRKELTKAQRKDLRAARKSQREKRRLAKEGKFDVQMARAEEATQQRLARTQQVVDDTLKKGITSFTKELKRTSETVVRDARKDLKEARKEIIREAAEERKEAAAARREAAEAAAARAAAAGESVPAKAPGTRGTSRSGPKGRKKGAAPAAPAQAPVTGQESFLLAQYDKMLQAAIKYAKAKKLPTPTDATGLIARVKSTRDKNVELVVGDAAFSLPSSLIGVGRLVADDMLEVTKSIEDGKAVSVVFVKVSEESEGEAAEPSEPPEPPEPPVSKKGEKPSPSGRSKEKSAQSQLKELEKDYAARVASAKESIEEAARTGAVKESDIRGAVLRYQLTEAAEKSLREHAKKIMGVVQTAREAQDERWFNQRLASLAGKEQLVTEDGFFAQILAIEGAMARYVIGEAMYKLALPPGGAKVGDTVVFRAVRDDAGVFRGMSAEVVAPEPEQPAKKPRKSKEKAASKSEEAKKPTRKGRSVKKNSAASEQDPALYREFRRVINMSPGEIERWRKDPRHRDASLPHIRAELPLLAQMKRTPMSRWTPKMWNKAMRAINFVKRHEAQMKVQGKRYGTGRLHSTYKRIIGLLNWGRKTPGVNIKNVLDKKTSKKSSRKTSRNISRNPSYSGSMERVGAKVQSPTELVGRAGMIVFAKDTGRALLLWRGDGDWSLPMTRIGYGENPRSRAIQAFYLQTSCPFDVTGPSTPLHVHDMMGQTLAVYVGYVPYEFMSSSPPGHLGAAWVNPYQLDQVETPAPELAHLLQVDGDRLMRMIPKG